MNCSSTVKIKDIVYHGECHQRIVYFMTELSERACGLVPSVTSSNKLCFLEKQKSDIPMAQFIINMNASLPQSQKFIIHVLDNTHLFVRSDVAGMIKSAIATFREQNTYEKPS